MAHARRFTTLLLLGGLLGLRSSSLRAEQLVEGDILRVYYNDTGTWNATLSDGSYGGLQADIDGTWVDFSYPGYPHQRFSVAWTNADGDEQLYYASSDSSVGTNMTVNSESDESTADEAISTHSYSAGDVELVKTERWAIDGSAMVVVLSFTNGTGGELEDLAFLYEVDPDQDSPSSYNTNNNVQNAISTDSFPDYVESVAAGSDATISFGACDAENTELGHYSEWYGATAVDSPLSDQAAASGDLAMGIRWTSPSPVADGETLVTSFLVLVSDSEAGAQTLYEEGLDLCLECDVDEDGVPGAACGGADCDDEDASVFPGAEDAWYDGLDSDCAGNDDYDQDGDGDPTPEGGGGDCDDLDPSVYLGAEDEWYDGVDSDCAGDDDFDQDGDGYASAGFGGDDCNEADPAINPGAEEIVGDGIDQNCDGSDEAPASDDGGGDGADGSGGDGADGSGGDGEDGGLDTQSGDEGGLDVQKGRDDDFKACGGCSADPRGLAGLWTLGLAALWLRRRARPHGGAELR